MWYILFAAAASAISLEVTNQQSISSAAATIAYDMMTVYTGNQSGQVPGLLPGGLSCNPNNIGTYCWWESGAMFGALINYWQYTGDSSYNQVVAQAMQFQKGNDNNFNPSNQTGAMGVDDQDFWAFTALDAVEANFPAPSNPNDPSWLSLAQATFNFQVGLWDNNTCGGGFRWQVFAANAGYNLKNTVSNGGNFQLAARLAYITGNASYAAWANKVYDWIDQSALYQRDSSTGILYIWDNTDTNNGCIDQTHYVWTYNYGIMLAGAAYMYNYTNGSSLWLGRVNEILNSTYSLFFPADHGGETMWELQCETQLNCNEDQKSFKAYLSRWMAVTALLVPSTAESIKPKLIGSAQGAAGQCVGGTNGRKCGLQWYNKTWDGTQGVGQQMAAMSVIGSLLNRQDLAPLSLVTGATSKSNPNAGINAPYNPLDEHGPIKTGSKVGAAFATLAIAAVFIGGAIWIVL